MEISSILLLFIHHYSMYYFELAFIFTCFQCLTIVKSSFISVLVSVILVFQLKLILLPRHHLSNIYILFKLANKM